MYLNTQQAYNLGKHFLQSHFGCHNRINVIHYYYPKVKRKVNLFCFLSFTLSFIVSVESKTKKKNDLYFYNKILNTNMKIEEESNHQVNRLTLHRLADSLISLFTIEKKSKKKIRKD